MKVITNSYKKIHNDKPLAVAIGNFDGVHLGHQALINKLLSFDDSYMKGIITFLPHTMQFFTKDKFQTIVTSKDKIELFKNYPIDILYQVEFNKEFASLSVDEMIIFLKQLNVKKIVIGQDWRFGQKGIGQPKDLEKDFDVYVVSDVYEDHKLVSSTLIKDLIINGDLDMARNLLNHPYEFSAEVIYGNQIGGKVLGFPTANLDYDNLVLPPKGVYLVKICHDDLVYFGMANIGYNPTVNYSHSKKLEVYIFDFDQMIYGEEVKIEFLKWVRPEKKFNSKEELILQLQKDENYIKKLSKTYKV
ncbi:MAG: bifunctional riboflavin kinase/FAD synthetase [Acholeplasmataceae bacterium]|nr:bifunctional riboflavin kinase/FAD synthetase [Acholeplasmataceae bacterium]